ncbi:NAD-dependent epimerase/dehydratase family protein [Myxococcota bacterium]|nr:NAD-dependent epimerase/dehydratase family protein [Myxococcota bacterium]
MSDREITQEARTRASTRPEARREVVITTGAAGNLGRLLVRQLHREHDVVAVDRREIWGLPKDVQHVRTDLRWRAIDNVFRTCRVQAILHLGLMHNPRGDEDHYRFNVVGTQRLLDLAAKHGVKKFVMLSSANIYGPDPDNSYFLTEDAPLLGAEHHPEIRDLVAVDRIVQSFFYRHPEVETVMLRPVHIVGPRVRNAPSNYLRVERPWTLTGFDPMIQLLHEEDLTQAMMLAMRPGLRGVYNIVGPGEAPLSRVLQVLGRRPIPVPWFAARPMLERAWRLRMTGFPPPELRHLQYNCIVDGSLARRVLGFEPSYSLIDTIRSVLDHEDGP